MQKEASEQKEASKQKEASEQKEAEKWDGTLVAIFEKNNFILIIVIIIIIIILTFLIKFNKNIVNDDEQKKFQYCDDEDSETNYDRENFKESNNPISKFLTGAP